MTPASSRKRRTGARAAALSLLVMWLWPASALAELRVAPASVQIGAFFDGAEVHVSGQIPRGRSAIVEVLGKRIEEQLLRKGRRWDIWMNVGEVDIEDAPCLYFALSTDPGAFSRTAGQPPIGYEALRQRVSFVGDTEGLERSLLFEQFVELKESEHLYGLQPGGLRVSPSSGQQSTIEGTFRIPGRVDPGTYRVRLLVLDQGRVASAATTHIDVRMVGLPAFLASLAQKHGALYGLFAILIAVVFGFLVGLVFRRGGRRR